MGAGVDNRDMDIDRVRATPLNHYFFPQCFHIYLFIFPFDLLVSFGGENVSSIKNYAQKHCLQYCVWVFQLLLSPPHPTLHPKLDLKKRKDWARLLNCPFHPLFFGALGHPVTPPDSCQWPGIATKPPNTHRWGKTQPFRNLL